MDKAILKTLIYADIFEYPLKAWEIHKWLIGEKSTLPQVEESLNKLLKRKKIENFKGYYFLPKRKSLVKKRQSRERISEEHLAEVKSIGRLLKIIPWIKLVGISGSLAVKNSDKTDDIDLFLITQKGRLFITRLTVLFLLETLGKRRKRREKRAEIYKKYCINILLEEDSLVQSNNNIYIAHEVLQMVPIWQKTGIYSKFLEDNQWAFKYLPNWVTDEKTLFKRPKKQIKNMGSRVVDGLEFLVKKFQLNYMGSPQGKERISDNALYFLPEDRSEKVLRLFGERVKKLHN